MKCSEAHAPVQCGLGCQRLLLEYRIRSSLRRAVCRRCRSPICTMIRFSTPRRTSCRDLLTSSNTLASKTSRTTNYERGLVFEYHLARALICRVHDYGYRRSLALVQHLQKSRECNHAMSVLSHLLQKWWVAHLPRLVNEFATCRNRSFDRKILLAVQKFRLKPGEPT
jgi:hypothetical protein